MSASHQAYRHARLERLLDHPNLLRRGPAPTALNRCDDLNSIRRIGHRHGCMPHTCQVGDRVRSVRGLSQGFHFPTIRASHHHPYDVKSAISVPRLFCEEEFGQLWSMGTRTFQKACDVAFQSHEVSGAPPPLERCQAPPAFAELAMRQLTALHSTVSSRMAMSQANACELKAALGHVVVSSSQTTGNMTVLMITIDGGTLSYDVSGAGPPIVFVAGLCERRPPLMAPVAAFSSSFQIVTFDHRGVGSSEGQPPDKREQLAADTPPLIDT